MRFSTAIFVASAGLAAAQSTSVSVPGTATSSAAGSSSSCQAQFIVDQCLKDQQSRVDACGSNEWVCLCQVYTDIMTCWNNCPDSDAASGDASSKTSYCNAAAPLLSSSSAAAATKTKGSSAQSTMASMASSSAQATSGSGSGSSGSGSSSSASASAASASTSQGAAADLTIPASGALAIVLGLLGML